MADKNDNTVRLMLRVHAVTPKAMLLSVDDGGDEQWTPKSQMKHIGTTSRGARAEFELMEWVAIKNGFIEEPDDEPEVTE